jgi:hypothetical protein
MTPIVIFGVGAVITALVILYVVLIGVSMREEEKRTDDGAA